MAILFAGALEVFDESPRLCSLPTIGAKESDS